MYAAPLPVTNPVAEILGESTHLPTISSLGGHRPVPSSEDKHHANVADQKMSKDMAGYLPFFVIWLEPIRRAKLRALTRGLLRS